MADKKDSVKELLLAEYRYFTESFWKNEETGEKRVQLFITLVTAILAGAGTLLSVAADSGQRLGMVPVFLFAFGALLALGIVTFFRIVKRNEFTDEYKYEMDALRALYRAYFDEDHALEQFRPFHYRRAKGKHKRTFGGLVHVIAVINSLLLAALIVLSGLFLVIELRIMLLERSVLVLAPAAVIAFVLAFTVQSFYVKAREDRHAAMIEESSLTHAGGIIFRLTNGVREYLVITGKKNPNDWILPRGHIEDNESIEETAVREVREETGLECGIKSPVGALQYFTPEMERVKCRFYLMEKISGEEKDSAEKRQKNWLPYKKARHQLTFSEYRKLLDVAEKMVIEETDKN